MVDRPLLTISAIAMGTRTPRSATEPEASRHQDVVGAVVGRLSRVVTSAARERGEDIDDRAPGDRCGGVMVQPVAVGDQ